MKLCVPTRVSLGITAILAGSVTWDLNWQFQQPARDAIVTQASHEVSYGNDFKLTVVR
jgi:hypothetical protein